MGYDISVRFGSVEEKESMYKFLNENLKLLKSLEILDGIPFYLEPAINEDIGVYAPKKNRDKIISFHGTGIPQYAWDLCCWMSSKSTYRSKDGNPVVFYDDEKIEVFIDGTERTNINIDKDGFRIRHKENVPALEKFTEFIFKNHKKTLKVLKELNELYSCRNNKVLKI